MVCVTVGVYVLISVDYTVNGRCLALYSKSFGKLDVLSFYCTLLLPCVVLIVLCVAACIYSFWHCCYSPGL